MQDLLEGRYVAGQKLTEGELTHRWGVGRGTVREAIKRLAAEGIVAEDLHYGARIRAPSRAETLDALEVIEVLNVLAVGRAADRLHAMSDIKSLQSAVKKLSALSLVFNQFEFHQLLIHFYRQLAAIAQNKELGRMLSMILFHAIQPQNRIFGFEVERRQILAYKEIVEALLAKDRSKAERLMRRHIRRSAEYVVSLPDTAFVSSPEDRPRARSLTRVNP